MAKGRLRFYIDEYMEEHRTHLTENMRNAMKFASEQAKRNAGRKAGSKQEHSKPGEFPLKHTGELQKSIQGRVDEKGKYVRGYLTIGTPYGLRIELGFTGVDASGRRVNQAARPVLRRTIAENARAIAKLITRRRRGR